MCPPLVLPHSITDTVYHKCHSSSSLTLREVHNEWEHSLKMEIIWMHHFGHISLKFIPIYFVTEFAWIAGNWWLTHSLKLRRSEEKLDVYFVFYGRHLNISYQTRNLPAEKTVQVSHMDRHHNVCIQILFKMDTVAGNHILQTCSWSSLRSGFGWNPLVDLLAGGGVGHILLWGAAHVELVDLGQELLGLGRVCGWRVICHAVQPAMPEDRTWRKKFGFQADSYFTLIHFGWFLSLMKYSSLTVRVSLKQLFTAF